MYRRVLVPLDGSRLAEAVLSFIEKVAGPLDMEIVLIQVVSLTPEEVIGLAPNSARREPEARQYLEPLASELRHRGLRARVEVASGVPATEIAAAAVRADADLIAMTTHGRSGFGRLLVGSIAEAVLRVAPVPVFLLKLTEAALSGPARVPVEVDRILFATDFSEAALAAWPTARSVAAALEAELIVQHVIAPLRVQGDFPPDIYSRYHEEARVEAERELAGLLAEAAGVKVRTRLDGGRAAEEILRAAVEERADLIVLGTAGRTGVSRLLVGSVAAEVVRRAPCPVVTVGPARRDDMGSRAA